MEVTPLVPQGRQIIQSYGGGAFTVAGQRYAGAVLVFPQRTLAWPIAAGSEVSLNSLAAVTAATDEVDLLLMGLGLQGAIAPAALRVALRQSGIAVEAMSPAAACRTFNVLLAEDRRVAAALLAIE